MRKMRLAVMTGLLSAVLLTGTAAAAEEQRNWDVPATGVQFDLPEEYLSLQGTINCAGSEYSQGDGVYVTSLEYIGMRPEELEALLSDEAPSEEEIQHFYSVTLPVAFIIGINQNRTQEELLEYFADRGVTMTGLEEAGHAGSCSFYMISAEKLIPAEAAEGMGDYKEEYLALREDTQLIRDSFSFYEPEDPAETLREGISFETTDLDGQPVSAEDLFAGSKVTLLNIWTTWCGYCIQEMPELEQISRDYSEKGCAVAGLLYDGDTKAAIEEAKEILADTGASYQILLPWDGCKELFPIQSFPTTFLISSDGQLIGDPIVGARVDDYKAALDAALEELGE